MIFWLINPTHEVLLANGYLKVAQLLLPTFHSTLLKAFGSEKIIIAAIKQLRRIKMKMEEYKNNGAPSPYAACVCDYLRATILCSSLEEVVDTVDSLAAHFKILQVTPRISPESVGNKVIIVHVEVEDKNVRPKKYVWSSWWDQQSVRMIAEVFPSYTNTCALLHTCTLARKRAQTHAHRLKHARTLPHTCANTRANLCTYAHTPFELT